MMWVGFAIGLFIGIAMGIFAIGLLHMATEPREDRYYRVLKEASLLNKQE